MKFIAQCESIESCVTILRSLRRDTDIIIDKRSPTLYNVYLYSPGIENAMFCPMYEGLSAGIVCDYFDKK